MHYVIVSHLVPAWTGAVIYAAGVLCLYPSRVS